MSKFKNQFRIESTRLKNWDYSTDGAYFVTICTQARIPHFGQNENHVMHLSSKGKIASECWCAISDHFSHIRVDEFMVMPDHIHGILFMNRVRRDEAMPRLYNGSFPNMSKISPKPQSLSVIIGSYKSFVAKQIRRIDSAFAWQPRFHDRIIRNERELNDIRKYIQNNPIHP